MRTFSSVFFVTVIWPFLLLALPLFCSWLDRFTGARYQPLPTPGAVVPPVSSDDSGPIPTARTSRRLQPRSVRPAAGSSPVMPSTGPPEAYLSTAGGPVTAEVLIQTTGRSA